MQENFTILCSQEIHRRMGVNSLNGIKAQPVAVDMEKRCAQHEKLVSEVRVKNIQNMKLN